MFKLFQNNTEHRPSEKDYTKTGVCMKCGDFPTNR